MGRKKQNISHEYIEAMKEKYKRKKSKKEEEVYISINEIYSRLTIINILNIFSLVGYYTSYDYGTGGNTGKILFGLFIFSLVLFYLCAYPRIMRFIYPLIIIQALIYMLIMCFSVLGLTVGMTYRQNVAAGDLYMCMAVIRFLVNCVLFYLVINKKLVINILPNKAGYIPTESLVVLYLSNILFEVMFWVAGSHFYVEINVVWEWIKGSINRGFPIWILTPFISTTVSIYMFVNIMYVLPFFSSKEQRQLVKKHLPKVIDYKSDIFWDEEHHRIRMLPKPGYIITSQILCIFFGYLLFMIILASIGGRGGSGSTDIILFSIGLCLHIIAVYKLGKYKAFFGSTNQFLKQGYLGYYRMFNSRVWFVKVMANTVIFYGIVVCMGNFIMHVNLEGRALPVIICLILALIYQIFFDPVLRIADKLQKNYIHRAYSRNFSKHMDIDW